MTGTMIALNIASVVGIMLLVKSKYWPWSEERKQYREETRRLQEFNDALEREIHDA